MNMRLAFLTAATTLAVAVSAHAGTNLVTNGGFEDLTNGTGQIGAYGATPTYLVGWTGSGYDFVFAANAADTTGAHAYQYSASTMIYLWGANNGGVTTTGVLGASPAGGNYFAADSTYEVTPLTQTISGLTVGKTYAVSFYYGGAQQDGYSGTTTEAWQVSLGGETQTTPTLTDVSHGFTGWQYETLDFTATSSQEVLSFLAKGGPVGDPPFSLLDDVSMTVVPEPAAWTMMILGLAGVGAAARRRRAAGHAKAAAAA